MTLSAFLAEHREDKMFSLTYYHNPARWHVSPLDDSNPVKEVSNWSPQLKYLNADQSDVSEDIKQLPNNVGGIYIFELKGITLPLAENYILYVGRCQSTDGQNIRKRAKEYFFKDRFERHLIKEMFELWADYLYYRYCPDSDNERIIKTERSLIGSILPPYNAEFPTVVYIKETKSAFE